MPMLLRKLNYRNIVLDHEETGEVVGVLKRTGEVTYVRWKGFVERCDALAMNRALPVKLDVAAYSMNDSMPAAWIELECGSGEMIQGCYVGDGVYAVCDNGVPSIVRRTRKE